VTTSALPPSQVTTERPDEPRFWLLRFRSTIFFFLIVLTVAGIYLATQIPISVFPTTNFPRVVIGVSNGVMPVEQMQVTITKPIEDAVNIVPGLVTVAAADSKDHHDPAYLRHISDSRVQPDLGHDVASGTVGDGDV
jgi:hypothetical protein